MSMFPTRKYPSKNHIVDIGNRVNVVFVTVCVRDRIPLLNNPAAHEALVRAWSAADRYAVGYYMIMPDHIHLFCSPASDAKFELWLGYWKRLAASAIPNAPPSGMWIKCAWDTQIRSAEHYERKLFYVQQNPVRAGLSSDAESWPFQGRLHSLGWEQDN